MPAQTPLGPAPYQPLFCEENAWHLTRMASDHGLRARAMFLTNARRRTAVFAQRASARADGLVLWDYHVIVAVAADDAWDIWDPDSTLGLPCPAPSYLRATLAPARALPPSCWPRVRVIDGDAYARGLRSTRAHMRDPEGRWLAPPPPWDPPSGDGDAFTLSALLDTEDPRAGPWMDPDDVLAALAPAQRERDTLPGR
jgi:hypothetical protein